MEKKSYESSLHVKPRRKNIKNTSTLSPELRNELKKLSKLKDKDIDLSDIPELDFDKLGEPIMGRFYRPIKKAISIRLDADLLDWFQSQPGKYQQLINKACRVYYLKHKKN